MIASQWKYVLCEAKCYSDKSTCLPYMVMSFKSKWYARLKSCPTLCEAEFQALSISFTLKLALHPNFVHCIHSGILATSVNKVETKVYWYIFLPELPCNREYIACVVAGDILMYVMSDHPPVFSTASTFSQKQFKFL